MVGLRNPIKNNNMKRFVVQKQLVPVDVNAGDPNWSKRQVWVLKLNSNDTIDEFDSLEEAVAKRDELFNGDPTPRVYKVVERIDDRFIDL
jgi:hypothetical protein